jgi:lysozyme family protein
MTFDQAFEKLLGHEGGYANNPKDPGGETMWGITIAVARRSGYDGEMKDLPIDVAKSIYKRKYWDATQSDSMPKEIRFDLFDAAVNSGTEQATKWLQRALNVTDDGVIGAQTLAHALKASDSGAGAAVAARFNGHRLEFMTSLSGWLTFSRGWARRIASNLKEVA